MEIGFGESVAPTAAICSILGGYPFSVGLLREILQNSDDAGARKQAFILDRRHHSSGNIYHSYLAATQGPALLAFNDALIQEEDWTALKNIHRSSKRTDTSKIGKYGIGFRSCYHITDNPHILSGPHLAILDPKHDFAEVGGMRIGGIQLNIEQDAHKHASLLSAFEPFLPCTEWGKRFDGTVFRFPLRTCPSDISKKIISPDEISDLLSNFALEELNVSLLFLRNISSVEIYEIDADGRKVQVATSTVNRTPCESHGQYQIRKAIINTCHPKGRSEKREWRILHAPFSEAEAIEALSKKLGGCPSDTLSHHKLAPAIDLAMPLDTATSLGQIGRLFTFLPLPLRTEFPIHINALFALTQSRQNLRNGGEVGVVRHSDDHALIEWNRILFTTYIPQAWANLLEVLVKVDGMTNVFDAWPRPQAEVNSGDYVYWKNIPLDILRYALDLSIWPIAGTNPSLYEPATALIVAQESTTNSDLSALVQAGLQITQPPQYLTDAICAHWANRVATLSPQVVHARLLKDTSERLRELSDANTQTILSYLLSTADYNCITGLALIPSVDQRRIALRKRGTSTPIHPLFDESSEDLFSSFDADAVSLKRLPVDVRNFLMKQGCQILNVAELKPPQIVAYLKCSPYAREVRGVASTDQIAWLNKFWDWVLVWVHGSSLYDQLGPFYLVPITRGFQKIVTPVFEPTKDVPPALLELLAVPLIDPRLGAGARKAPKQMKPTSDIRALLSALSPRLDFKLTEEQAQCLCSYLVKALPSARAMNGTSRDNDLLRSRLRALPIYPIVSLSTNGKSLTRRTSIGATSTVRGVNLSEIPVLPQLESLIYLDLRLIDQDVLSYLDSKHRHPLTLSEMLNMMLEHLHAQSLETQVAFVRYLGNHSSSVPRGIFDRLADQRFVPTCDGSLQAPNRLVDPEAKIGCLFPSTSSSLPDLSQPLIMDLISRLRGLGLLISQLSVDIVRERAQFIAETPCPETENIARNLINLVNDTQLDCRRIFKSPDLSLSLKWIPTHEGLKSPVDCRDRFSHSKQTHLFDEVLPLVKTDVSVSPHLRMAFEWDGDVALEILSKQLVKILNGSQKPYNKVRDVIKEIGNRDITDSQLASLRQVLREREWVPTRSGELKSPSYALLGSDEVPAAGFHCVNFSAYRHRKVLSFLRRMGCCDEPSTDTILEHLETLHRLEPERVHDSATIKGLVRLLAWLPPLTPAQRSRLIIPDTDGVLRGFNSICFNDIGDRAYLADTNECALVHPEVHDGLAQQLGLPRLGLFASEGQDPNSELDMGEDLMTTIRNRLREYIDSQLLVEFLANASDAGATEFGVLLDEKEAPAGSLLSPRCEPFQRGPALVIHNNGVFTKDDFKGILRTGIGGKAARSDTIGQFGLGALTMFHVTELAMIVSGDQVLFLNPCKAHLLNGRGSLQVPLARMRKFYNGHLSSLLGVFGFHPPEDTSERYYYDGTIFRLPLRSSSQFVDIEPVFKKIVSFADVTSHFESIAPQCLLFTNISNISLFCRQDELQPMWSVAAIRDSISRPKQTINAHTITISRTPRLSESQVWRVMSITVHEKLPSFVRPLREQYRLRIPPVVRIAACHSPTKHHALFSTLPLPISLDLPVHISASFILASDRRSIRLDEYENRETQYNRWLLTTVIPQLYLHLLEDLAGVLDNEVYWPGNLDTSSAAAPNTISTMIIDAVYQAAVVSDRPILRSKFYPSPRSPQTAHLSSHLPRSVRDLLEIIKPLDLVELPSQVTGRLRNDKLSKSCVSIVTPAYVQSQVVGYRSQFDATTLKFERVLELIEYQLRDKKSNVLFGLPFLPLEDGTFSKFEESTKSCFYVVPPEVQTKSIFEPRRLVHHDLPTRDLLTLDQLNVEKVTDTNIGRLLCDHLPQSPTLTVDNGSATYEWIQRFWETFPLLNISPSAIAAYPLIPTVHTTTYISITHCGNPSVVLADFTYYGWLAQCFTRMGFTTIDTVALPSKVRHCLNISHLNIETVFSVLQNHPTRSIQALFKALDSELHSEFARWAIADMHGRWGTNLQRYKILPIWRTPAKLYVSANEVIMLPQQTPLDAVGPFCPRNICDYHTTLNKMGVGPCSSSSVRSLLSIPEKLKRHEDGAYKGLVDALLLMNDLSSLPLPNSERTIRESNTLYSSQDDLFLAAFGADSNRFILPSFRHFEEKLDHFGLRRQNNLTMAMFRECAKHFEEAFEAAIDADAEEGFKDRAAIVFRNFAENLPLRTSSNVEDQWKELDKLCFVPRDTEPKPLGNNISIEEYVADHARHLPDVVSPNELVRPEFSAIAWTQRAFYDIEPHPRLLLVHPALSVPSVEDVVNHLVVLATKVARDHPGNVLVLSHLQQTYKWLNDKAEEARPRLLRLTKGKTKLFLNVNDPATEPWEWTCGNRIWLETYDAGQYRCVREFLKPLRQLLVAAGAVNIDYPDAAPNQEPVGDNHERSICTSFDRMRREAICTDVHFIFKNGDPLQAHRSFLAAFCDHFREMFSGSFSEAGAASAANPIKISVSDFSRRCVELVLVYTYTGEDPEFTREDTDIGFEMLELTQLWGMLRAHTIIQNVLIGAKLVNPSNLDEAQEVAQRTKASALLAYCNEYRTINARAIQNVQ